LSSSVINLLTLRDFGVDFGKRKILTGINLDVGDRGITHLLGPCGAGKSTLLRSLAGLNDSSSLYRQYGEVFYKGELLGQLDRPLMLEQKPSGLLNTMADNIIARLPERGTLDSQQQHNLILRLLEQYDLSHFVDKLTMPLTQLSLAQRRMSLLLRLVVTAPELILLDEPTADLSEDEAREMLDLVRRIAERRAVLLVQHNQEYVKYLDGNAILLAGGTIQEQASPRILLSTPASAAGKEFAQSGTCAAPSPDTDPAMLDEAFVEKYKPVVAKPEKNPQIIPFGPQGFRWIERNKLAATPRPGIGGDLEFDLKALARVQVDYLVSLEEVMPLDEEAARQQGIHLYHLPIVDMQTPSFAQALQLNQTMHQWLEQGKRVAVHCKAGLGRTGTMLAAYYIAQGMNAVDAVQKIRLVDPRMIQSTEQEEFVFRYEDYIAAIDRDIPGIISE